LLASLIRKSKIIDDDDDDDYQLLMTSDRMKAVIPWHLPKLLPERSDITKAQCTSKELLAQTLRKSKVSPARYLSEEDVPSSPAPMTAVEEALDVASQAAAVMATIPFFSMLQVAPAPALAPAPSLLYNHAPPPMNVGLPPPPPRRLNIPLVGAPVVGATADIVQGMGLPLFLVGSNVQALQTLAATPSLLNTFVDANGMYDQSRLMSLVQALSQNLAPSQPVQQMGQTSYGYQQPMASSTYGVPQQTSYQSAVPTSTYGTSLYGASSSASHYGPASTSAASAGVFRGKSDAGNLHVSGYGPMTTQADIIALFAPYVHVDEVVMKANFSFVNTTDPDGATRAREALSGALLGGSPIRINPAQRRDPSRAPPPMNSIYGGGASSVPPAPAVPASLSLNGVGQIDYASVRDDRGNPATKNLFVAGYGPGTTEQQIRDYFGQHCTVTACVLKGTFSFVNTGDKSQAVNARSALMGTALNGGSLRINFAKESGRLGTSFDTTYGSGSQSRYGGR
jgi:RNA recognition motif-containing protein